MSAFNGTWKRSSSTNVDAFLSASGLAADVQAKVRALFENPDVVDQLSVSGNTCSRKTLVGGAVVSDVTNEMGKPFERQGLLGTTTVVIEKVSDSEIHIKETGDNVRGVIKLKIAGNNMEFAWTLNGVTATRQFTKQ